jgi:hypothetical protein
MANTKELLGAEFDPTEFSIPAIICTNKGSVYFGWVRPEDYKSILRGSGKTSCGIQGRRHVYNFKSVRGIGTHDLAVSGPEPTSKIGEASVYPQATNSIENITPVSEEALERFKK